MHSNKLSFNTLDVSDSYIDSYSRFFIDKNITAINALCFSVFKDNSKLSMLAFQEIIFGEIKKACYSFVNNNHNSDYIDSYLFSCIHKIIKSMNNENKHSVYVCPGCKYLSKLQILNEVSSNKLSCNSCKNALISTTEQWESNFHNVFAEHSKKGFSCPECDNFIPECKEDVISCPYPNCIFVGNKNILKIKRHPTIKANMEIPSLSNYTADSKSSDSEIIIKDDIKEYIRILIECIDSQILLLQFKSNESTLISKLCMYQAYKNIIDKYPNEMISYLVFLNRNIRLQHKIFQEFVKLLEEKIPFSFKKGNKHYNVLSLLDDNLCVFDGISEYNAVVDDNLEIPNLTEELYVGGRKGSYCRPYYIGKIIEIYDIDTSNVITNNIKEYSFFKITMTDGIKPGTKVHIKHLRIFPHYQMGGMVYLNRIRRLIVDKVYLTIHGEKRIIGK